jgi:hypothetical protein
VREDQVGPAVERDQAVARREVDAQAMLDVRVRHAESVARLA